MDALVPFSAAVIAAVLFVVFVCDAQERFRDWRELRQWKAAREAAEVEKRLPVGPSSPVKPADLFCPCCQSSESPPNAGLELTTLHFSVSYVGPHKFIILYEAEHVHEAAGTLVQWLLATGNTQPQLVASIMDRFWTAHRKLMANEAGKESQK